MYIKILLLISSLLLFLTGCKSALNESTETSSSQEVVVKEETKESEVDIVKFEKGSLIDAVTKNDIDKVREILKDDSYDVNEVNDNNESSLLIATHNNQIDIAKLLIDSNADVNQQDDISDSSYLYAGAQGKFEILSYIIEKSDPNQSILNRFGGNSLIPAAEKGHLENVKLLLKDGSVDINLQNNYGYTALIEAVALNDGSKLYQDIVQELLSYDANINLRDNSGRTALDYAKSKGYSEIVSQISKVA